MSYLTIRFENFLNDKNYLENMKKTYRKLPKTGRQEIKTIIFEFSEADQLWTRFPLKEALEPDAFDKILDNIAANPFAFCYDLGISMHQFGKLHDQAINKKE
jgi:hypothetical protein